MAIVEKRLVKRINWILVGGVLAILCIGLFTLYSATRHATSDPFYYVKRQLIAVAIGTVGAIIVFRTDYHIYRLYTRHFYWAAVGSLLLVLLIGRRAGGAQSWFRLGAFQLQPSEFAKLAFIFVLADQLESHQGGFERIRDFLPILISAAVPLGLVILQPDLGTALVFAFILMAMLFVVGVPARVFGTMAAVVIPILPLAYHFVLRPYQRLRLLIFLNPWADRLGAGYNVIQSSIAIGAGRFFGKGYLRGTQAQLRFLPAHHTDFIFSVFAEENGFVGCVILLGLFLLIFLDTVRRLPTSYDRYGMFLTTGLLAMWTFHVFENVGMALGVMPVTGIPLPFVSYGGSAMIVNLTAVGLVANVQARRSGVLF
ncbi:MAG: rod shape-determining protein RodA [Firmicutes bacterium]|jgi:rod shape determining protein RodA|nr:rod shape-determining protein RodA [Bacillota bacterium]